MKALSALALSASLMATPVLSSGAFAAPVQTPSLVSMQLSLDDHQKAEAIQAGGGADSNKDLKEQFSDPWFRGACSFVVPGAGQWFNSDEPKDWWHLGIAIALPVVSGLVVGSMYAVGNTQTASGNTTGAAGSYLLAASVSGALTLVDLGWHVFSGLDAYNHAKQGAVAAPSVKHPASDAE